MVICLVEDEPLDRDVINVRLYTKTCENLGIPPSSSIMKTLNSEQIVMKNHVLGAQGAKAVAIALVVRKFDVSQ